MNREYFVSQLLYACLVFVAVVLGHVGTATAQPTVLVAGSANGGADLADIQAVLVATGRFATVDTFDSALATPTVAEFQAYHAVLLYNNVAAMDSMALGNNAAEYVDGGGGVVEASFANGATQGIHGNWDFYTCIRNDQDAFVMASDASKGTVYDAGHPIIRGLATLNGGFGRRTESGGVNGATVIMDWNDGTVAVLVNQTFPGRIASINMHPASNIGRAGGWIWGQSDIDLLFAQALEWATDQPVIASHAVSVFLTQGDLVRPSSGPQTAPRRTRGRCCPARCRRG